MPEETKRGTMSEEQMIIYLHDVARLDKDLVLSEIADKLAELVKFRKEKN
jgi:hypothetical protein